MTTRSHRTSKSLQGDDPVAIPLTGTVPSRNGVPPLTDSFDDSFPYNNALHPPSHYNTTRSDESTTYIFQSPEIGSGTPNEAGNGNGNGSLNEPAKSSVRRPSATRTPSIVVSAAEFDDDANRRIAAVMFTCAIAMLLFTALPVVVNFPNVTEWFSGDTLFRLFDPLVTLPLNWFVLAQAEVMVYGGIPRFWGTLTERTVISLLFLVGAAIYVQGHGIHLASAMFKHPIENFNDAHPDLVLQYPVLYDIYLDMEDLWEHKVAHYMYAFGGMWMSWCVCLAYRSQEHPRVSGPTTLSLWIGGIIVYGLLLAGVAIEFPYGLYVGLVYVIVFGAVLGTTLLRRGAFVFWSRGRAMVLQFYFDACCVALIVIVAWIAKYGLINRKAAIGNP
ncbi:hypothetical protein BC938DRAFT_471393 [Jimgerdemannia flammicorona]|uniref:Transmembrane protein n=2 Tax=Jimgerdemannia flammicorona TaxID=994334 RepID=A0A433Q898_9FUNG|nr:hypothetical protein BC938DRAFT_471393 [Jimgerdemannia flammicorona]